MVVLEIVGGSLNTEVEVIDRMIVGMNAVLRIGVILGRVTINKDILSWKMVRNTVTIRWLQVIDRENSKESTCNIVDKSFDEGLFPG